MYLSSVHNFCIKLFITGHKLVPDSFHFEVIAHPEQTRKAFQPRFGFKNRREHWETKIAGRHKLYPAFTLILWGLRLNNSCLQMSDNNTSIFFNMPKIQIGARLSQHIQRTRFQCIEIRLDVSNDQEASVSISCSPHTIALRRYTGWSYISRVRTRCL